MKVTLERVAGSAAPRVVAHAFVAYEPTRIWTLIRDTRGYPSFMPSVRSAEVLEADGDDELVRMVIAMPFPLSDLVAVTRTTHLVIPGERWERRWTLERGDYHVNDGAWVMRRAPGGTSVSYTIHADAKVRVPRWLVRYAQQQAMPKLFEALRARLAAGA